MSHSTAEECCPRFDPAPWDAQTIRWEDKPFVKDRVRSFLHIPLNFPIVMQRCMAKIAAADAQPDEFLLLADENSLWGADVYIAVTKEVPNATMATISGTFLCEVFEGPFRDIGKWIKQMHAYVEAQGKTARQLYFYYTTCPKCAKKYRENYVVILARIDEGN